MTDTLGADDPAPMISSPVLDETASPVLTTFNESLESTVTRNWNEAVAPYRSAAEYDADEQPPSEAEQRSWWPTPPGQAIPFPPAGSEGGPPILPRIKAEDANAMNKQAGGTLTPFAPGTEIGPNTFQQMLKTNLENQKADDVVSRSAAGILASPARFTAGLLVSLANPYNDAAMLIPGLPEAGLAEALGGGILARAGARAATGAAQNAALGIGLAPFQASQAASDHEDFSWGETLRNAAYMSAFGALHGGIAGALSRPRLPPETVNDTMAAAVGRVMQDHPSGVDVQAIIDQGEVTRLHSEAAAMRAEARAIPTPEDIALEQATRPDIVIPPSGLDPVAQARVDAATEELTRPGAAPSAARAAELHAEIASMTEGRPLERPVTPRAPPPVSDLEIARNESQRQGLLTAAARAEQSAADMATRATSVTDPELVRAQRINANTIATAPKLEGVMSRDHAEATAMLADKKAEYDGLVASGALNEHPSLADAGKDHEDYGKAIDAYAKTCAFGG